MRIIGGIYGSHGKRDGQPALVREECDVVNFPYNQESSRLRRLNGASTSGVCASRAGEQPRPLSSAETLAPAWWGSVQRRLQASAVLLSSAFGSATGCGGESHRVISATGGGCMPARNPEELDRLFSERLELRQSGCARGAVRTTRDLDSGTRPSRHWDPGHSGGLKRFCGHQADDHVRSQDARPDRGPGPHLCQVGPVRDRT